ncbi:hypothetical protein QH494_08930 [Sphingomonas sp. AR_OL41]|uniref:hypothetical protein n=1 Tax=Sphingomonas sp. AR_OL41 TaxID=3042729 RepID=UPI00247FCDA0|nr:hypothetical protein [Sphingomonas sp. AR_OL41]MDH7972303.1 hypothetical protein [Sphingomonas sp. AR_OL41]
MRFGKLFAAGVAVALVATPAMAGFSLMAKGKQAVIATSTLSVTPGIDWNKLGKKPGRNAEAWTLDGSSLNDLVFYAGIMPGQTLFKAINKKDKPLPTLSATMLPPDIAQLFESSYRIANATSLYSTDSIEPATFAGHAGFHFTYSFTVQDEEVRRKGEATGAIVGGKLYMITYEAPEILYFGRNEADYQAVVSSAALK